MSDGSTPESIALALGKLIGTVDGLARALNDQNVTASKNRDEFMEVFKGIRQDNKEDHALLAKHIEDDAKINQAVIKVTEWMQSAEERITALWDGRNTAKGALWAGRTMGGLLGGGIVALIEWCRK